MFLLYVSICKNTHFISISKIYFQQAALETAKCEAYAVAFATAVREKGRIFVFYKKKLIGIIREKR